MSRTYLFAVRENGNVTRYAEVRNAWGGAAHIWMTMIEEHHLPASIVHNETMQAVWDAPGTLGETDDWVLLATFDHAIVPREWMPTYLTHLRTFTERYPTDNLHEQIGLIERMVADSTIRGVGWNQTSVNGDNYCNWSIRLNPDEEGSEGVRPYNIDMDTDHFFVSPDELARLASERKP